MDNPEDINFVAEVMKKELVLDTSREVYEKVYSDFKIWRETKEIKVTDEDVLFTYISELEPRYTIISIKKKISILKTMLKIYEKIECANYVQLQAYTVFTRV